MCYRVDKMQEIADKESARYRDFSGDLEFASLGAHRM